MKRYILNESSETIETHINFAESLNEQQYEVVTQAEGPCLVLAGAGSGKTRTLIYRLAYLLERGVPPQNILLMTFTNKAAREMRERTERLLRYSPKGLWSGTFHHVGNRTLRMYAEKIGFTRDFGILDQQDSRDLIKSCTKTVVKALPKGEKFPKASVMQAIISLSVNTKRTLEKVLDARYPYFFKFKDEINKIKDMYEKKKRETENMDYDDLLFRWKYLLENVEEVREKFSNKFRYIMVDEYQDTNYMQAEIVDILGGKHRNILAVGDDAQSIYSFRGARVENILQFPEKFDNVKIFKLETNYRSTPEIVALANDSLLNNDNQFQKELKTVNESLSMPALVEVRDLYSQASFVVQRIKELLDEGVDIKNIAVLFRAHYQSAELEMGLVKRGISYVVRGGLRFFEQAHIKDVLAYMKILANPLDETSWIRALTLWPGIGPGYASKIYEFFKKQDISINRFVSDDVSIAFPARVRAGYSIFQKIMRAITSDISGETNIADIVERILDLGYETHVLATYENAKERIDDIRELVNFSHDYETIKDFVSDTSLQEGVSWRNKRFFVFRRVQSASTFNHTPGKRIGMGCGISHRSLRWTVSAFKVSE
ncbi:MAG: ATP-dependent helicase [Candidatus Omnitrophota bacterium]